MVNRGARLRLHRVRRGRLFCLPAGHDVVVGGNPRHNLTAAVLTAGTVMSTIASATATTSTPAHTSTPLVMVGPASGQQPASTGHQPDDQRRYTKVMVTELTSTELIEMPVRRPGNAVLVTVRGGSAHAPARRPATGAPRMHGGHGGDVW